MSDIVYFKQDGQDVDVSISEVSLSTATLNALETTNAIAYQGSTAVGSSNALYVRFPSAQTVSLDSTADVTLQLQDADVSASNPLPITGTVTANLSSTADITLQMGDTDVSATNPLASYGGSAPYHNKGGINTRSNVGDTPVTLLDTGTDDVHLVLGVKITNGSAGSETAKLHWGTGTSSSALMQFRDTITIAAGDTAHVLFPPQTYVTNAMEIWVESTATSGMSCSVFYQTVR